MKKGRTMAKKRLLNSFLIGISVFGIISISLPVGYADQNDAVEITLHNKTVKLYNPIEIKVADMYSDGGTIAIILEDIHRTEFSFCLDARMEILKLNDILAGRRPKFYKHIYLNAKYPTDARAYKVPIGGKEEKIILKILQDWLKNNISLDQQKKLLESEKIPASDIKEYKAKRILRLVEILENR